jgi:hypothetical protein
MARAGGLNSRRPPDMGCSNNLIARASEDVRRFVLRQGLWRRGWKLPTTRQLELLLACAAALLLILPACSGGSGKSESTKETGTRDSELSAALQRVLDDFRATNDLPGVSAAVLAPGVGLWSGASGVADIRTSEPLKPNALLPIGDVSKNLTAALLVKLAEDVS